MECAHCHRTLEGRRRTYCDASCKKRAWRRRRAGLREDELVAGGRRGRVPLGSLTRAERAAQLAALRTSLDITAALLEGKRLLEELDTPEARRRLLEYETVQDELRDRFPA